MRAQEVVCHPAEALFLLGLFSLSFSSTGDGANREQRLFVADSFSDHPQLADSADPPPPLAAPAINLTALSSQRCCSFAAAAAAAAVAILLPPLQLSLPFGGGVGQLIDGPCERLVATRPPPARHHGENMSRVAARTRPGSILSLWSSETESIKKPFISSNCTLSQSRSLVQVGLAAEGRGAEDTHKRFYVLIVWWETSGVCFLPSRLQGAEGQTGGRHPEALRAHWSSVFIHSKPH